MGFHWLAFDPKQPHLFLSWEDMLDSWPIQELWLQLPEDFPIEKVEWENGCIVYPEAAPHLALKFDGSAGHPFFKAYQWAKARQIPIKCIDWPISHWFSGTGDYVENIGFHSFPNTQLPMAMRAAWMDRYLQKHAQTADVGIVGENAVLTWLQDPNKTTFSIKKPSKVKVHWIPIPIIAKTFSSEAVSAVFKNHLPQNDGSNYFQQISRWTRICQEKGIPFSPTDLRDAWILATELAKIRGKGNPDDIDTREAFAATHSFLEKSTRQEPPALEHRETFPASRQLSQWLWKGFLRDLLGRQVQRASPTLLVSEFLQQDQELRKWLYRGVLLGFCPPPDKQDLLGFPAPVATWSIPPFHSSDFSRELVHFASVFLEKQLYQAFKDANHPAVSPLFFYQAQFDWWPVAEWEFSSVSFKEALEWLSHFSHEKKQIPPKWAIPFLDALERELWVQGERIGQAMDMFLGLWEKATDARACMLLRKQLKSWSAHPDVPLSLRGRIFARWLARTPQPFWPHHHNIFKAFSPEEASIWLKGLLGSSFSMHAGWLYVHASIEKADYAQFVPWIPIWQSYFSAMPLSAREEEMLRQELILLQPNSTELNWKWAAILGQDPAVAKSELSEEQKRFLQHLGTLSGSARSLSNVTIESVSLSLPEKRAVQHALAIRKPIPAESREEKNFQALLPVWKKMREQANGKNDLLPNFRKKLDQMAEQWMATVSHKNHQFLKTRTSRQKIDLSATIRHNLAHYDPARKIMIPRIWKMAKTKRHRRNEVLLCIDRSLSMEAVYPALLLMANFIRKMSHIRLSICLFDEDIYFIDQMEDITWNELIRLSPGGTTNLGKAVAACAEKIQNRGTFFWLWSDLRDIETAQLAFTSLARLKNNGTHIGFAYPTVPGAAPVHQPHVAALRAMQIPCFFGSVHQFPDFWMKQVSLSLEDLP